MATTLNPNHGAHPMSRNSKIVYTLIALAVIIILGAILLRGRNVPRDTTVPPADVRQQEAVPVQENPAGPGTIPDVEPNPNPNPNQ